MTEKRDSSPGHNVASLHGGQVAGLKPNPNCIAELEKLLERAKAGEITGIACAALHHDNLPSYTIRGMVGPYSLLGDVDMMRTELTNLMLNMK